MYKGYSYSISALLRCYTAKTRT